jgi:hypothetical protein
MANPFIGGTRAAVGQGIGMGWGDEAEAWLRSKLGNESYEDNLKKVRNEYAEFSQQYPVTSGTSEFLGGAAPGVAMMMYPPTRQAGAQRIQSAAAATASRVPAWAKLAGAGGVTGAVSGAGSATEGERGSGAFSGGVMGTTLGLAVPMAVRGTKGASGWLRERLFPTDALVERKAAEKMAQAMAEDKLTTAQIQAKMAQDKAMGVPSVVANTNPALADLAEAVAQRTGSGARKVEKTLMEQKLGARERAHQQTTKALQPGDYYDDLANLQKEMRTLADPAYLQAYSHGEVTDPKVLKFLQLPQFKQGLAEAEKLLAAEGRELDMSKPTVEVLDQVKRGIDTLIEGQTDSLTGKTTSLGRIYVTKKNEFLKALDKAVPDYEIARGIYAGGAELQDAMRKGINEFGRMDHEQVIKLVSGMGESEKHAFRTGVARDLYDKIMKPSGNFNAAQRLIGSPEMQAKLQPLFDNPAQFELFKNALEREAQLFNQSNKILGGSPTGKRTQMREMLEDDSGIGEAMVGAVTGGWKTSLARSALGVAFRKGQMTEKTSAKLADMLMSKDPHEVAAVVKMLDEQAAAAVPKAIKASATEGGATTGTASAIFPSPEGKKPEVNVEADLEAEDKTANEIQGPDIDADLEADSKKDVK